MDIQKTNLGFGSFVNLVSKCDWMILKVKIERAGVCR
jgi:hypothetical protein